MMRDSGLSQPTITRAIEAPCDSKRIAEAISDATGGDVTVAALLGLELPDVPSEPAPDTAAGA